MSQRLILAFLVIVLLVGTVAMITDQTGPPANPEKPKAEKINLRDGEKVGTDRKTLAY